MLGPPISAEDPIRFAGPLPPEADVVIIGGGVAGVTTALYLARDGVQVVLCEKGRIAGEQSSRNWGWVRAQGRDPAELPIMLQARELWAGLAQELGDAVGLRRTGVTYLANDEKALAAYEGWLEIAGDHGLDSAMLTRDQLQSLLPNSAGWVGALQTASDQRAEPFTAVPAIAALAVEAGVTIIENCAVRCLQTAAGRVTGVVTEKGAIRSDRVLLAGGAWSGLFARNEGQAIPQLAVRATVAATAPMDEFWPGNAADSQFAFRRRLDGGYTLAPGVEHDFWIGPDAFRHFRRYVPQLRRDMSHTRIRFAAPKGYPDAWGTKRRWKAGDITPFERMRVLNPPPNPVRLDKLRQDFASAFPRLGSPDLARTWAGMIDVTPDQVPILDETPLAGFFIATGLSGHGFGIGPGIGRVMADLIQGKATGHDLSRFRFSRFSDGTPIELGPTI